MSGSRIYTAALTKMLPVLDLSSGVHARDVHRVWGSVVSDHFAIFFYLVKNNFGHILPQFLSEYGARILYIEGVVTGMNDLVSEMNDLVSRRNSGRIIFSLNMDRIYAASHLKCE